MSTRWWIQSWSGSGISSLCSVLHLSSVCWQVTFVSVEPSSPVRGWTRRNTARTSVCSSFPNSCFQHQGWFKRVRSPYRALLTSTQCELINPRHMCQGYDSCSAGVSVSVCLFPRQLLHTSFMCWMQGAVGVFKICIVWILLKMLCLKVLVTFADPTSALLFLTSSQWTRETVMATFQ